MKIKSFIKRKKCKKSAVKNRGCAVKMTQRVFTIFFWARLRPNRLRQKRCRRGKLFGLEEEKIQKKKKIEGVTSITNSKFFHSHR